MTAYLLTDKDRQKAHSDEAREKRLASEEERRQYQREDVLLLRKRGMVPLAIADELDIGLRRVRTYLEEAGEVIPYYVTTSGESPREPKRCRHCGEPI